jgi:hypothetical protein
MAKEENPIRIKPSKEGSFTEYCRRKGFDGVTSACIAQGKKSKNPKTRKKATFAGNARLWNRG